MNKSTYGDRTQYCTLVIQCFRFRVIQDHDPRNPQLAPINLYAISKQLAYSDSLILCINICRWYGLERTNLEMDFYLFHRVCDECPPYKHHKKRLRETIGRFIILAVMYIKSLN